MVSLVCVVVVDANVRFYRYTCRRMDVNRSKTLPLFYNPKWFSSVYRCIVRDSFLFIQLCCSFCCLLFKSFCYSIQLKMTTIVFFFSFFENFRTLWMYFTVLFNGCVNIPYKTNIKCLNLQFIYTIKVTWSRLFSTFLFLVDFDILICVFHFFVFIIVVLMDF